MSRMSQALDRLYAVVHDEKNAGEWITYHFGTKSVSVLATLETAEGVPLSTTGLESGQPRQGAAPSPRDIDHDFSILAADLKLDGVPIEPQAGNEIKRIVNGRKCVYRVGGSSKNSAVWEWQDGYDKRYLIHAKFVRFENI